MLYHITGLCPRTDITMGRCGFSIQLWPEWKELVECFGPNQSAINTAIEHMARQWLDGCGFNHMYDPDLSAMDRWEMEKRGKKPKFGPKARPLYGPHDILVTWGAWGPEHITVPGDACGLDLSEGLGRPPGGAALHPHNVDSINQAHLLLVVFTWCAETIIHA